jgi:hypothetical protein
MLPPSVAMTSPHFLHLMGSKQKLATRVYVPHAHGTCKQNNFVVNPMACWLLSVNPFMPMREVQPSM